MYEDDKTKGDKTVVITIKSTPGTVKILYIFWLTNK